MAIINSLNTAQLLKPTSSPEFANLQLGSGGALRTKTSDTNTVKLQAYDVDGTAYVDLLTATAGNTVGFAVNYTPTLDAGVDLDMAAGNHTIGASIGANTLTLGGALSTVTAAGDFIITGDLTVNGTTITANVETVLVEDKNIVVNHNGTTAGATNSGIDIEGDAAAIVGYFRVASDNANLEFKAPGNAGVLTVDINATKTITVAGDLNISGDSVINQSVATTAQPTFAGIISTGDFDLTGQATDIDLIDNNASALSFDAAGKAGILEIVTTDSAEGVNMSGFLNIGSTVAIIGTIDDDTMATASDTTLATSESIKAYIDSKTSIVWSEVTGTTQSMSVESGYIANNASLVTLTLPATAAVGDLIEVVGKGAGLYVIAQNAGQTIYFGDTNTTTGAGGSLTSTERYTALQLICITENTSFVAKTVTGNFTSV